MSDTDVSGPVWLPSVPPSLAEYPAPHMQPIPLIPALALMATVLYLAGVVRLRIQGPPMAAGSDDFLHSGLPGADGGDGRWHGRVRTANVFRSSCSSN